MASKPGILTEWPWKPLGSYKHVLLAPWAIHSIYWFIGSRMSERDYAYLLIFPFLLLRMLHDQIWISLSRYRTAKRNNRIVDKAIEFDQVDRERNWDDQILFNGLIFYIVRMLIPPCYSNLPFWRSDGVILTILLHMGPVEFLYYWFHRALHHHYLYSRYHSHHHSSIVTEPITSVIHPFAEHVVYFLLFAIPLITTVVLKNASIASFAGYIIYIDFMNNMGHCNFEFIPMWLFTVFPRLKFLMYTPSYHSLHHTQFRTNYSLFMPIYDYIYGTMDRSSDSLYEKSIKSSGEEEESADDVDVVHLTHLTTLESIYHLRIGFASLASKPHSYTYTSSQWYLRLMWPFTASCYVFLSWIYGRTFVSESNTLDKLKLQTWVVPRYMVQYNLPWRRDAINSLIEGAILKADERGVKVISLGLLNQGEVLNRNGEFYLERHPNKLKIKVVDGSSLAAAVVVNSVPKGTAHVLLRVRGTVTADKVACAVASSLCQMGIKVATLCKDDYKKLKLGIPAESQHNLVLSTSYAHNTKVWLVGDDLAGKEQARASTGTIFIPYTQIPPRKLRKDCFYHSTPAMIIPPSLNNMHSCENWLGRRVMSAWRISGIIHALEGWNLNECGQTMCDIHQVWQASLRHGFRPLFPVA